ncbi:MAG: YceD family protein [Caulobacteraceae bacterium]
MADDLDVRGAWREVMTLAEAQRGAVRRQLEADAATRARIAKALGLDALHSLTAVMKVSPWLDGVQIDGQWRARVGQTCGVTLEPFESDLEGEIHLRALPQGSAALGGADEAGGELDLDPEGEDPPEVLADDKIDLGAYLVEDLSLAIDPFPKKPGVEFEAPEQTGELSPFAVLAKLKGGTPDA